MAHTHEHHTTPPKILFYVLCISVLETYLEIIIGHVTHNNIINLAGGIHTLSDSSLVLAALIAALGLRYTQGAFTKSFIYTVFTTIASFIFFYGGIYIILESGTRLLEPKEANAYIALKVGLVTIFTNLVKHQLLHHGAHASRDIFKLSLSKHIIIDMMIGIITAIGATVRILVDDSMTFIDPVLSILVGIWLIYNAFKLHNKNCKSEFEDLH